MSNGIFDAYRFMTLDEVDDWLGTVLDEDTQVIERPDVTKIPSSVYDEPSNRMLPNTKLLKCTCGAESVQGGHVEYCDLVTGVKSEGY